MKKILALAVLLVMAISVFAAPWGISRQKNVTKAVRTVTECKGDINNDGHIDFFDIDPFVAALNPASNQYQWTADITGDGVVNQDDVDPFVAILGTNPSVCHQIQVPVPVNKISSAR